MSEWKDFPSRLRQSSLCRRAIPLLLSEVLGSAKAYAKPFERVTLLTPHRHPVKQSCFSPERLGNLLKVTQQACVRVSIYIQACVLDFHIYTEDREPPAGTKM